MKLGMLPRQIEQGVHLHRRFGRPEMRPRKGRQAQVDGRRIQSVDRIGQIQTKILLGVQLPRLGDQSLGQISVNPPISRFVGIGQRRAPDRFAEAHVIQSRRLDAQARLDIPQTLPVGQLRERHGPVLLGARKCPHSMVAIVPGDNLRECRPRHKIHELREQRLAGVHGSLRGKIRKIVPATNSSRHRPFLAGNPRNPWLSELRSFS
jgi:hypothetical protein